MVLGYSTQFLAVINMILGIALIGGGNPTDPSKPLNWLILTLLTLLTPLPPLIPFTALTLLSLGAAAWGVFVAGICAYGIVFVGVYLKVCVCFRVLVADVSWSHVSWWCERARVCSTSCNSKLFPLRA
jgi:hypothetical protein